MRFFLDENLPQALSDHLSSIFRPHEFVGVQELNTKGVQDIELFRIVADAGCHVFVTADLAQLRRDQERMACREAHLHWIGVHQVHAPGYHVIAGPASTLIHALPFALDRMRDAIGPQYFQLKKSQRNFTEVFQRSGDL